MYSATSLHPPPHPTTLILLCTIPIEIAPFLTTSDDNSTVCNIVVTLCSAVRNLFVREIHLSLSGLTQSVNLPHAQTDTFLVVMCACVCVCVSVCLCVWGGRKGEVARF